MPVLVWLVRDTKRESKNQEKKHEANSDDEEPYLTKVVREEITKKEFESLKKDKMNEEESEAEIDIEQIKCLNYFVYDFPQTLFDKKKEKFDSKFEMQAICTENYLIYTTPKKVNFISLKQVAKAKALEIEKR